MAEASPSVLFSIRLLILQPKCAPLTVKHQADFHFDSRQARQDFIGMILESKVIVEVAKTWEQRPPQREGADAAFERALKISEADVTDGAGLI